MTTTAENENVRELGLDVNRKRFIVQNLGMIAPSGGSDRHGFLGNIKRLITAR